MKQIQIQGQTIELPFTEEQYESIVERYCPHDILVAILDKMDDNEIVTLSIGLHLAEKEKQGEIERLEAENSKLWHPMETAPKTGEVIEVTYGGGESCLAFWSDRPVCMLGSTNGGYPAGWATAGPTVDRNLPLDTPEFWRPEQ